jgi:hypothetical protein
MQQKQPIPLVHAGESVRLEERGPVPDGYLGHRSTPAELEEQFTDEPELVRLGLGGWLVVLILGPIIAFLLLGLLWHMLAGPFANPG